MSNSEDLQKIVAIRSLCSSPTFAYIIEMLENDLLKNDIEVKMMTDDSVTGEWRALKKIIQRLRQLTEEYEEKLEEASRANPNLRGMLAADRIP
jgi:hypothetical protein